MATAKKQVMVVGIDESEHSTYAFERITDRFFPPCSPDPPLRLVVVHARPPPSSATVFAGPGAAAIVRCVDADLKKVASRVIEKAKETCAQKSVKNVTFEVVEGDPRNVLCDAVEKHHASFLAVGSHGYGAVRRALIGSVSDYCAHHADCIVMIVKRQKIETYN